MKSQQPAKSLLTVIAAAILATIAACAQPQQAPEAAAPDIVPVNNINSDNYPTAEADRNFSKLAERVEVNTWLHQGPVTIDQQETIRSNVDTIYSNAIVDISKGATFTVPADILPLLVLAIPPNS